MTEDGMCAENKPVDRLVSGSECDGLGWIVPLCDLANSKHCKVSPSSAYLSLSLALLIIVLPLKIAVHVASLGSQSLQQDEQGEKPAVLSMTQQSE